MKFLVGYNGSSVAKSALTAASDFAKVFHARIFVMTSLEGGTGETLGEITKAENDLRQAKTFLEEQGLDCETHQLARGLSPGEDLVKFAEDNAIDQIFVGIEKKSKRRGLHVTLDGIHLNSTGAQMVADIFQRHIKNHETTE